MSMLLNSCANNSKQDKESSIDVIEANLPNIDKKDATVIIRQEVDSVKYEKVETEEKAISKPTSKESPEKIENLVVDKKPGSKPKTDLAPKILFEQTTHDFGRIVQGEQILHEFIFTNRGKSPLVIKNAEASCGCTRPIYPFVPIEPGKQGTILVQFNRKGRLGRQAPKIDVISNASKKIVSLHMIGEVVTPEFAKDPKDSINN